MANFNGTVDQIENNTLKVNEIKKQNAEGTYPTTEAVKKFVEPIMNDYIVERGVTDIWTWEKWNSGKAVCWGISSQNISINQEWTNGWKYGNGYAVSYPQEFFIEMPICTISKNNYNSLSILEIGANGTNTQTPLPRLICAQSRESASQDISFYAIGKWK